FEYWKFVEYSFLGSVRGKTRNCEAEETNNSEESLILAYRFPRIICSCDMVI
ncbi:hypothetical protein ANCCAN_25859, partial [Ancylostoma caninum]